MLQIKVNSWGTFAFEKRALNALMRGAANDIKSKTARLISKQSGSGRVYSSGGSSKYRGDVPKGPFQSSAPGEPPILITGFLKNSMKSYVFKDGDGFAVRQRAFYALFLEAGARGGRPGSRAGAVAAARRQRRMQAPSSVRVLEPRPSLDRVLHEQERELDRRIKKAVDEGVTWRQTR